MRLTFLGAAGTVTGSRFLVENQGSRVLVDCGLFQGLKSLRLRNWEPFPVPPDSLDGVVLTHAHLDHSGYLPRLVREGFDGEILCTPATARLCEILLPDSGRIHEQDARFANKKGFSKHKPALPLYTEADALEVSARFRPVEFDAETHVGGLAVRFQPAGHILGAASVRMSSDVGTILFSGDLGRANDPLLPAPAPPGEADWIVMESTYGDRSHPDVDPAEAIGRVVRETVARRGVILVASFAVGRAQSLVYWLNRVFELGLAPRIPVFVDSPMASDVTSLYREFSDCHRLPPEGSAAVCEGARFVRTVDESKWLGKQTEPMVIVAASGMMTGGRILHHLKTFGPRKETCVLITGFQAAGTRGATLLSGGDELKIHGKYVKIRARVERIDMLSAHADQGELLEWIGTVARPVRRVFLVHGEPGAADALRVRIQDRLGIDVSVARDGESATLDRS